MANMFDVIATMSAIADNQIQQMANIESQIVELNDRIDSVQSTVDSSMSSVDDSIQKIEDITSSMVSATDKAIQEQINQAQIMESEQELEEMKFKNDTIDGERPDVVMARMMKMIGDLKINVQTLLDADKRSNVGRNIKDIGQDSINSLMVVLTSIFGAGVVASLFMAAPDKDAEQEQDQNQEEQAPKVGESENKTAPPQVEEQPKNDVAIAEDPGEVEQPKQEPEAASDMGSVQASKIEQLELKEDPVSLRKRAIESGESIKRNGVLYHKDGTVIGEISDQDQARIIESGGTVIEPWAMEYEGSRKEYPEYFEEKVSAKPASVGEVLMNSNEKVEKAEDQTKANIAQNMITVINQSAPEPERPPRKTPAVMGKVTLDKILT